MNNNIYDTPQSDPLSVNKKTNNNSVIVKIASIIAMVFSALFIVGYVFAWHTIWQDQGNDTLLETLPYQYIIGVFSYLAIILACSLLLAQYYRIASGLFLISLVIFIATTINLWSRYSVAYDEKGALLISLIISFTFYGIIAFLFGYCIYKRKKQTTNAAHSP